MNFLAHAYLSFNDPGILVGNMISDFVKGRKKFDYPLRIQTGIQLHRSIDAFTDCHPATIKAKKLFSPAYRLYSGALVDVVYDHFLANDKTAFDEQGLASFTKRVYATLQSNFTILPETFQKMFPYMQLYDWLYNYIYRWGIEKSLQGLVRRSLYLSDHMPAFEIFNNNYQQLQEYYDEFFKDVRQYAAEELARH